MPMETINAVIVLRSALAVPVPVTCRVQSQLPRARYGNGDALWGDGYPGYGSGEATAMLRPYELERPPWWGTLYATTMLGLLRR